MFALEFDIVVIGDDFGADEAAFEIGVDDAGGLRCGVALVDGPGAHFLDAGSEVGLQAEQGIGGADDAVEAGFGQAHFFEEQGLVFVFEVGDFAFDLGADGDDRGVFLLAKIFHLCQ